MENNDFDLPLTQPLSGIAMHAFLALAAENRPEKIPLAISRTAAHASLADCCYLISPPENGSITCFDGFNRVKEEILSGIVIPNDHFSVIIEAMQHNTPLICNQPDELEKDTLDALSLLGKVRAAPFCLVPVVSLKQDLLGGLLVLSPYSGRTWQDSDVTMLTAMADAFAKILQRVLELAELKEKVDATDERTITNQEHSANWVVEETGEQAPITEAIIQPTVKTRIGAFFQTSADPSSLFQAENDLLLNEIIHLSDRLQGLEESTSRVVAEVSDENFKGMIEKIREEVRGLLSPLSAITGYHDLLISESVGTLTPMQQKFLDRIRTAADKMHEAIEHVELVTETGDDGTITNQPQPDVQIQKVLEESFKTHQQIIADRELEIKLVSPADLPFIYGSRTEIQPVVNKILNSMLSMAPNGADIHSKLSLQIELDGSKNILWKATTTAKTTIAHEKEMDEFSEYLQENVFNLADRLNCQLWMDAAIHTEREVNLLFPAA